MRRKDIQFSIPWPNWADPWCWAKKYLLPNPGTVILIALLFYAQAVGAGPFRAATTQSTAIPRLISYQGRLTDAAGDPVANDNYRMVFSLYCTQTGGEAFWTEDRDATNKVPVSDGFFNVLLGQLESLPTSFNCPDGNVYLGIRVDPDISEMDPRELLASVPYAFQAVEVPDGSITTEKLAEDAVDGTRIAHAFGASGKPLTNFVMRSDITGWDWSDPAHTGGWLDFDASSIVPPGTTAVLIRVHAVGTNNAEFGFRKNGLSGPPPTWDSAAAFYGYMPPTGGDHAVYQHYIVELDSNRIFEHDQDANWSQFMWVIQGWWEPVHQ
jgi:hypothetical protein